MHKNCNEIYFLAPCPIPEPYKIGHTKKGLTCYSRNKRVKKIIRMLFLNRLLFHKIGIFDIFTTCLVRNIKKNCMKAIL